MMPTYHIGTLSTTNPLSTSDSHDEDHSTSPVFLSPKAWHKALLTSKTPISPDTTIFHFTLPHPSQQLGLPVGQHLMIRLRDPVTREAIIRAYTPLSSGTEAGELRVLIKIYRDGPDGKPGGKMTQALDSLPLGHAVEFKGPVGKFEYLGLGRCSVNGKEKQVKKFVMVCGGSGITPIWAVLRAVMGDEGDGTECVVLDGNKREEDILLKGELDGLEKGGKGRCRVVYALSRPGEGWKGVRGRMDRGLFEREVGKPPEERDTMVLICGPEGMERTARETLLGMGWEEGDLLFF
ncbi:hypothetical protein VTI74DRAFT_10309 [Chaetomium olivicolor]